MHLSSTPRIIITPGEPAGVGPEITVAITQQAWPAELIVIADPHLLEERAKQKNVSLKFLECDLHQPATPSKVGQIKIFPIHLAEKALPGKINLANAPYVIQSLSIAAELCLQQKAQAIVTGPVNKSILNQAGIKFSGHTEFFAEYCKISQTVMLFVLKNPALKVALATTHLPLSKVPVTITKAHLTNILSILKQELIKHFHIANPRIFVCGLNPHAGENGYLGREEIETITPLLEQIRAQGENIFGPLPADTIFTNKYLSQADVVLAMYHDQALPLIKYLGFGQAVNVTLGLPFLRTSVDHGTALDIAGTEAIDASSMFAAVELAIEVLSSSSL